LEKLGHTVIAPDLPGLGRDPTPAHRVSLRLWRDFVCGILDAQTEPVILVGHSRGGIAISEAAEHRPDRIRGLAYVAAFMIRSGENLLDVAYREQPLSIVQRNLVLSQDKASATLPDRCIRDAFYGQSSDDEAALARLLLSPEPTAPLTTPLLLSDENFGRVPRVYIECLRDGAISPVLQKQMYTALPRTKVVTLDTDHSPFISRPDELAEYLHSLSNLPASGT
jgi:pimeloyl-ACP methyl ester carboxylesterase